jgi:hypothetical protein
MYIECIGYRDAMYGSSLLGHDTFLKNLYKPHLGRLVPFRV